MSLVLTRIMPRGTPMIRACVDISRTADGRMTDSEPQWIHKAQCFTLTFNSAELNLTYLRTLHSKTVKKTLGWTSSAVFLDSLSTDYSQIPSLFNFLRTWLNTSKNDKNGSIKTRTLQNLWEVDQRMRKAAEQLLAHLMFYFNGVNTNYSEAHRRRCVHGIYVAFAI